MINSIQEMSIGNGGNTDLLNINNQISYRDLKPALRVIKIIEAIEAKFNVTFTTFGRAVFHNAFMWLSREAGQIKAFGQRLTVDLATHFSEGFVFDAVTDKITYIANETRISRKCNIIVKPASFLTVPYIKYLCLIRDLFTEVEGVGNTEVKFEEGGNVSVQFKVQSTSASIYYFN
jgi:hypothetical protein